MTDNAPTDNAPNGIEIDTETLITQLRQKQGTWVDWAIACQQLQKHGQSAQQIFEQTGFEPIQQNQIIVAVQVYAGLVEDNASEPTLNHFKQRGSDSLHELRILSKPDRLAVAELLVSRGMDSIAAKEAAKAVKEIQILSEAPSGFTRHPGDAIAYQAWKSAQNQRDPQQRAKFISKALQFAHSDTARTEVEKLLTGLVDPTVAKAPRLPIFRLEESDEMPRVLPLAGKLPLTVADLQAIPTVETIEPFRMVRTSGDFTWVALPGWQVVRRAIDAVVILADTDTFKEASGQEIRSSFPNQAEEILLLVDRAQVEWQSDRYYAVEKDGKIALTWFGQAPTQELLGQVLLILRQPRILDEELAVDVWQVDE
ncbi:hypothetical protein Pse7367_0143 [Thalassoporum mexicanum PCC 7367]|uniref:RuBisCO accumulation factor 1 n=1 Tax=Thalassoporum mexicanum TaxID=3457544 RepID=UPI00029F8C32|nr:RuBisCO accumulation factor 1 [Pseudanabaena sp. PCC 7367]AFY68460.1 hypothetical protein Pse7367_0143 [Pseudanabaena sp. PCC 7367]